MNHKRPIIIDSFRYDDTNDYSSLVDSASGLLREVFDFLWDWYSNDEYILVSTSGSTGEPKEIELSKEMMIESAKATCEHFGLTTRSTLHLCLPVKYIAGKMMLVRAMVSGAKLILEEPSATPFKTLNQRVDFAALTPMQVDGVLNSHHEKINYINQLIIGGGAVGLALSKKLQGLKTRCYSTYGMTETATHVAVKVLNGPVKSDLFCAVGRTGFTIDERSCLVVTSRHLGIKNLVTNDVVELADNQAFRWLGRFDNVINTGGVKVFPERIEAKLANSMDRPYFVIGVQHQSLGEEVVLIVEGNCDPPNFEHLDKYERPKRTISVDSFVYTPTNKIQRNLTLQKALNA